MTDFSTTQSSGSPVQACPDSCREAYSMVMDEVNQIARLDGPLARNRAITAAYDKLAQDMPQNDWVRLASYVSVQGGCAMQATQGYNIPFMPDGWLPRTGSRLFVSPEDALAALGDANLTIFSSIYPANRMVANCGYEKFRQCVDSGEIDVPEPIVKALGQMNRGALRDAADTIALYEQRDVVQPVYDRWAETFEDLNDVESWLPGDQTSIPIAKECTRDNLVPLEGNISNWRNRVNYYGKLIDRMYEVEGITGR